MWRRTGKSSALDKAQALLSKKKHNKDANLSKERPGVMDHGHTDPGQLFKRQTASPSKHIQDLSDMSSVSLVSENGDSTVGLAAAGKNLSKEKDPIPQTSPGGVGGGSSRFLKKATPPSAISNSHSPVVSRTEIRLPPERRYVSTSQRSSQNTALSRLALIEERVRIRKESHPDAQVPGTEVARSAEMAASELGVSPQPSASSSSQASRDIGLRGKRFLKKTPAAVADDSISAAGVRKNVGGGVSTTATPLATCGAQPIRMVGGVCLDSDEEDVKKLLGDTMDSMEDHRLRLGRTSSMKVAGKRASPPQYGSPLGSPSLARYQASPSFSSSPPRAPSSISGRSEVLSLEELFPVGSQRSLSERSVSSEDFKINVMTLDDLAPASLGLTEVQPECYVGVSLLPKASCRTGEDEVADYQSDFESESRSQAANTASEVSELLGREEDISEIQEEVSDSDRFPRREREYSDTSRSCAMRTSSPRRPRWRLPRSSLCSSDTVTPSPQATSSAMRDAGVQTVPDALGYTWSAVNTLEDQWKVTERKQQALPENLVRAAISQGLATMDMAYVDPTPVASHTIGPEAVEALSAYSPAVFALNDMLRQQLAMTRQFIQTSRHLHVSLVQNLGPADYSYTTLEDTKEFIRKNKPPKLTVEQALEEVLQEMRDYHYI